MSVENFKQTYGYSIILRHTTENITGALFKDYLVLLKPHEYKNHRIFLVSDIFFLDPELELAEKTVLIVRSEFRINIFFVYHIFFI